MTSGNSIYLECPAIPTKFCEISATVTNVSENSTKCSVFRWLVGLIVAVSLGVLGTKCSLFSRFLDAQTTTSFLLTKLRIIRRCTCCRGSPCRDESVRRHEEAVGAAGPCPPCDAHAGHRLDHDHALRLGLRPERDLSGISWPYRHMRVGESQL